MIVNLLLYHFNNYYNRKLKVHDNLNDYGEPLHIIQNVQSFNPGDGVSTSHVINHVNIDLENVDYALIVANNVIISRWFVLDGTYTRNGQTVLTLYRDTIAEQKADIFNAPMFIEKATVSDDSPFIYNAESLTVNEIKKSETLLKDKTECAWLVGYLARDYAGGEEIIFDANVVPDSVYSSIEDYPYYDFIDKERRQQAYLELYVKVNVRVQPITGGQPYYQDREYVYNPYYGTWKAKGTSSVAKEGTITDTEIAAAITDPNLLTSGIKMTAALAEVGKIIKAGNDYLQITATSGSNKSYYYQVTEDMTAYSKAYNDIASIISGIGTINTINIQTKLVAYRWILMRTQPTSSGQFKVTLPAANNRYHLVDAPYDMFCMPYGHVDIKNSMGSSRFILTVDKGTILSIAQGLKAALASNIYDIQLLPYCPLTGYSVDEGGLGDVTIDILNADPKASTIVKTTSTTNYNIAPILWCTQSQSSLYIDYTFDVQNTKMSVMCDKLRFCSPNYSAAFEINPAKNEGISGVNVDYTYMPFTPYIHVAPVFSGLYGSNFGDARGLICQGDFSITTYDDKFAEYQVQNKNYLNVFNREIENMEVGNDIARQQAIWQTIAGTFAGGVQGATAGSQIGGKTATGVTAGVGAALSLAGGIADYQNLTKMQAENLDFKKDLFGYSLDNIKALPNTIAKITTITANNKLFPFVEYYTCTDEEKVAVANKIKYNGMSVGAIGTINEYADNTWSYDTIVDRGYVKGQIIDVSSLNCDYHMANAIAEELNKGIYLKGDN